MNHGDDPVDALSGHLRRNLRALRLARGWTQAQCGVAAGVPRATIAKLEAGAPNPTLATTARLAAALRVSLDELVAAPTSVATLFPAGTLPSRTRGGVELRPLLPHPVGGLTVERMALAPRSRLKGAPHAPGSREYLACESGRVRLTTPTQRWDLGPGDVVFYAGDQPHGYTNPHDEDAVAYTVVVPPSA